MYIKKPCNVGLTIPALLCLNTEGTKTRKGLGPKFTFFRDLRLPVWVITTVEEKNAVFSSEQKTSRTKSF